MLPYLLTHYGGQISNDIHTPLSIERAEGLVNNYKVPESGLTDVLLMHSHAIGGIDSYRASYLS